MKISAFSGEYDFLSNFYTCQIKYKTVTFFSVEAAFQAAKANDIEVLKEFSGLSARDSKKLGRKLKLRPDWETVKVSIMRELLIAKFTNKSLAEKLLGTGDAELIEGNTWNDTFWGVCKGKGDNMLGKLLMELRDSLK